MWWKASVSLAAEPPWSIFVKTERYPALTEKREQPFGANLGGTAESFGPCSKG